MEKAFKDNIIRSIKIMIFIVGILWISLVASFFLPINEFGIRPRSILGLSGIVLSPFLHAGFAHLVANTLSLFVLGSIFFTLERKLGFFILAHLIIIGGFGTWLIGRSGFVHLGASGLIYGLMGYLIFFGIFKRNFKAILVSVLVFILYGGMIWGVLPGGFYISWESHLCGFIAGIVTARMYTNAPRS